MVIEYIRKLSLVKSVWKFKERGHCVYCLFYLDSMDALRSLRKVVDHRMHSLLVWLQGLRRATGHWVCTILHMSWNSKENGRTINIFLSRHILSGWREQPLSISFIKHVLKAQGDWPLSLYIIKYAQKRIGEWPLSGFLIKHVLKGHGEWPLNMFENNS